MVVRRHACDTAPPPPPPPPPPTLPSTPPPRLRFRREERRSVLAAALETQPGFRYLRSVLTQLPDYVTLGEGGETCEWLTKLVAQVFPAVQV